MMGVHLGQQYISTAQHVSRGAKGKKGRQRNMGLGFQRSKRARKKEKKVELDFTVKGICAACRHFCWNHLQSMKQESCFFKIEIEVGEYLIENMACTLHTTKYGSVTRVIFDKFLWNFSLTLSFYLNWHHRTLGQFYATVSLMMTEVSKQLLSSESPSKVWKLSRAPNVYCI